MLREKSKQYRLLGYDGVVVPPLLLVLHKWIKYFTSVMAHPLVTVTMLSHVALD
jgi:hypothetical protein